MLHLATFAFALANFQDWHVVLSPVAFGALMVCLWNRISVPVRMPAGVALMGLFAAYLALVSYANGVLYLANLADYVYRYGKMYYTAFVFLSFWALRLSATEVRSVFKTFILATSLITTISVVLYPLEILGIVDTTFVAAANFVETPTIKGMFSDKNPMAACVGSALIVNIALLVTCDGTERRYLRYSAVVLALGFVLANSRGYFLGFVAALVVAAVWARSIRRTAIVFAPPLVAMGIYVMGSRLQQALSGDFNVLSRLVLWQKAISVFLMSPLTGLGAGSYQQFDLRVREVVPGLVSVRTHGVYMDRYLRFFEGGNVAGLHAHNLILQMLVDGGILALVVFGAFLYLALRRAVRTLRSSDDRHRRLIAYVALLSCVYLFVAGTTGAYTFSLPHAWPFFFAVAMLYRSDQEQEQERAP